MRIPEGNHRLQEVLSTVPMGTLALISSMTLLHVGAYLVASPSFISEVTIAAYPVIYQKQLFRILSAAFFHANLMHIGMNMMSFWYIGSSLESLFGTLHFIILTLICVITSNVLYVGACVFLAMMVFHDVTWLHYASVGFSGVIFSMAVLESFLSPIRTRSVFGCFEVPTKIYPWVLLVVLQIMMPNISFLGHLTGLLVGILYVYGLLGWAIPNSVFLQSLESRPCMQYLVSRTGYKPVPSSDIIIDGSGLQGLV